MIDDAEALEEAVREALNSERALLMLSFHLLLNTKSLKSGIKLPNGHPL